MPLQLRPAFLNEIETLFQVNPVVALLGPRQCGKTTLAKQYIAQHTPEVHFFDLENPIHIAKLNEPMLALGHLTGLIVIDEIQFQPELFPVLRVLVDEAKPRQFLILGSASRDLIQQSSETLAGRISYLECTPFGLSEVTDVTKLFYRGGFPKSYLAANEKISAQWRQDYISTFLERDIPALGFRVPARTMRRFWMMLAHYHGQTLNLSELGQSLGVAHTTIRSYLEILVGTFMIRELYPWFENIQKRQVKASKIYIRDSGLFLSLLNVQDQEALNFHPKLGAVWEGFALEQVIQGMRVPAEQCFFWGVHQQVELDLLTFHTGQRVGFEFKYQDAPSLSKSMQRAYELLNLDKLYVIYPGKEAYPLAENIEVRPLGLNANM